MLRSTTLPVLPSRSFPSCCHACCPQSWKTFRISTGVKGNRGSLKSRRSPRSAWAVGAFGRRCHKPAATSHSSLSCIVAIKPRPSRPYPSIPALSFLAMFFRPSNGRVPFSPLVNYADLAGRERCVSRLVHVSAGILPAFPRRLAPPRGGRGRPAGQPPGRALPPSSGQNVRRSPN